MFVDVTFWFIRSLFTGVGLDELSTEFASWIQLLFATERLSDNSTVLTVCGIPLSAAALQHSQSVAGDVPYIAVEPRLVIIVPWHHIDQCLPVDERHVFQWLANRAGLYRNSR